MGFRVVVDFVVRGVCVWTAHAPHPAQAPPPPEERVWVVVVVVDHLRVVRVCRVAPQAAPPPQALPQDRVVIVVLVGLLRRPQRHLCLFPCRQGAPPPAPPLCVCGALHLDHCTCRRRQR